MPTPLLDTAADAQIMQGSTVTLVVEVPDQDGNPVNIAGASELTIYLTRPRVGNAAPVTLTKTATLDTNGTDGAMKYTTTTGDLNVPGEWKISAYVACANYTGSTPEASFVVHKSRRS